MQFYTDPTRENDEYALPDAEVFHYMDWPDEDGVCRLDPGFYWWLCFPGCLPDGDPIGPFETEEEAIDDAREEEA